MKKEERIKKYGSAAYEKDLKKKQEWNKTNQDLIKTLNDKRNHKGGEYYERMLIDNRTGLRGKRNKIRNKHRSRYYPFKQLIAPNSQIHHEWIPGTPDFRGVALVETNQHRHGYIDVIQILEGEITLLTEGTIQNVGVLC